MIYILIFYFWFFLLFFKFLFKFIYVYICIYYFNFIHALKKYTCYQVPFVLTSSEWSEENAARVALHGVWATFFRAVICQGMNTFLNDLENICTSVYYGIIKTDKIHTSNKSNKYNKCHSEKSKLIEIKISNVKRHMTDWMMSVLKNGLRHVLLLL